MTQSLHVTVDRNAWLRLDELTPSMTQAIKTQCTILPRKVGNHPGDPPKAIQLWEESATHLGVPREYFLGRNIGPHNVEINSTFGARLLSPDLTFKGTLREEQARGLQVVLEWFKNPLHSGGMVQAKPGWGKCCRLNTFTTLASGERVQLGDLIGREPEVVSLLADGSVGVARASKIWLSGEKECFRLTLASGQWFEGSADHPVLTQHGFERLDVLRAGRELLVGVSRQTPEPDAPLEVLDAEAIVAGLYLADGASLHHGSAQYVKGSGELVALFEQSVQQLSGFKGFGEKSFVRGAWYVRPLGLLPWLRGWGIAKPSKLRRIPGKLFRLGRRQLALLIRALWTDGNLYLGSPRKLEITLASEGLIDDLQEALRRFGVVARKTYAPKRAERGGELFPAWRLQVADKENLLLFAREIGAPFGQQERFAVLLESLADVRTNTNWDVVPVGKAELKEIRESCRHLSAVAWQKLSGGGGKYMGRRRFQRLVEVTGYKGRYARFASGDLVWEAVRSVEAIGVHPVADLTVPDTGNVVANGIVVHNTVWCLAFAAIVQVPVLVIVHKEFLMNQWKERIAQFLPDAKVGHVQEDVCDFESCHIVLAMVHSLSARKYPAALYRHFGLLISDECHRVGARTWSSVPAKFPARWRLGVTATPRRKDGADNVFRYQLGPIVFVSSEQRLPVNIKRVWTRFRLVKTPSFNPQLAPRTLIIQFLCASKMRNNLVAAQVVRALLAQRKILVLSERLKHLDRLDALVRAAWHKACKDAGSPQAQLKVGFYVGGRTKEQLDEDKSADVIYATKQYAAEGLDIPPLDTLILATPMSDVEQAVGRIQRPFKGTEQRWMVKDGTLARWPLEGKKAPIVVDIRDDLVKSFQRAGQYRDRYYEKAT